MKSTACNTSSSPRFLITIGVISLLAASANRATAQTAATDSWTPTTATTAIWNNESTWSPGGVSFNNGNAPDDYTSVGTVYLTGTMTGGGTSTVTVAGENTTNVGVLDIGTTGGSGTFLLNSSGGYDLIMNNLGAGSAINEIATSNGDTISAAIQMADTDTVTALTINNLSGHTLTISGGITSTGTGSNLVINANSTGAITLSTTAINNQGTIVNTGTSSGGVTISAAIGTGVTNVTQNSATSALTLSGASSSLAGSININKGNLIVGATGASGTGTITLGSGSGTSAGLYSPSGTGVTISNNIVLSSSAVGVETLTVGGGPGAAGTGAGANLTLSGTLTMNGNTLNVNDQGAPLFSNNPTNGQVTVSGTITGTGNLVLGNLTSTGNSFNPNSAGSVTLSGSNGGYSGFITLQAGTLRLGNAAALGTGTLMISPGTYGTFVGTPDTVPFNPSLDATSGLTLSTTTAEVWNSNFTFVGTNSLNLGTGAISLGTEVTPSRLVSVSANTLTVGGVISNGTNGTTALIKSGAGTLVLNGANTYTGGTVVNQGVLSFGSGAVPSTGSILIDNGGILTANGAYASAGAWLTSGSISSASTGVLALTGGTDSETLNFSTDGSLMLGATATSTFTGAITAGSSGYHLGGGGSTLVLSGANTLDGSNALTVGATSIVGFNASALYTSTLGTSAGTVDITNTDSMSGATKVNAGTLDLSGQATANTLGSLANSAITVSNGATLAFDSANITAGTVPASITRAASVTMDGGVFTDTGSTAAANTDDIITGALTINSGANTITVTTGSGAKAAELNAASLSISAGGFAFVNGVGLGSHAAGTAGDSNIIFTTAPTSLFVGSTLQTSGGDTSSQKNTAIIPELVGVATSTTGGIGTAGGTPNTFVTYDSTNGLRPLNLTDEFTNNAITTGNNTWITAATTSSSTTSINSLVMGNTAASTLTITDGTTLTDASGALLFNTGSGAQVIAPSTSTGALAFGTNTAYVDVGSSSNSATISAVVTGSGGLIKTGVGNLNLTNTNNSYSGTTAILNGTLTLGNGTGSAGTSTIQLGDTGGSYSTKLTFSGPTNAATTFNNNVVIAGGNTGVATISFLSYNNGPILAGTLTLGSANAVGTVVGHNVTLDISPQLGYGSNSLANGGESGMIGAIVDPTGLTGPGGVVTIIEDLPGKNSGNSNTGISIFGNANSTYSGGTVIGYANALYGYGPQLSLNGGQIFGTGTVTENGMSLYELATAVITGSNNQVWNADWSTSGSSLNLAMTGTIDLGNIASGTTRTIGTSSDLIVAGTIVNGSNGITNSLAMTGTGDLVLLANESYTGTTTMTGGILQYGGGGTTGSADNSGASFVVPAGGTLVVDRSDNQALGSIIGDSGTVTGAGGFQNAGSGVVTVSGAETYTGTTTLSGGGTLDVTGSINGSVGTALTFSINGGTFNYDETGAVGSSHSMGTVTNTAGADVIESTYGSSGNTVLALGNLVSRPSGAVVNFVDNGGTATTNQITISTINGVAPVAGTLLNKGYFFDGSSYAAYDAGGFVRAYDYTTDAGGLTTSGATSVATTSSTNLQVNGNLTAQASTTVNTINLTGSSSITQATNSTLAVVGLLKSGSGTSTISSGTLSATGVELNIRTDLATDELNISSVIAGSSANSNVTKSGAGVLALSGTNSFNGNVYLTEGTLDINSANALSTVTAGTLVVNNGTTIDNTSGNAITEATNHAVTLNGDFTYGGSNSLNLGTGAVSLGANDQLNRTITTNGSGTLTLGGVVSNGNNAVLATTGLIKAGAGTLALSGGNTYTGGTTVNAGTLIFSNTTGSASGTGALAVNGGGTIGGTGTSSGTHFSLAGTGTGTGQRANVLVGMTSAMDTNTTNTLSLLASSTATITNANLTFNLNDQVAGQGTELNVGSTAITFTSGVQSTTLTLNIENTGVISGSPLYVLVAGSNGGVDQYSGLSLGTGVGNIATGLLTPILNSGVGGSGDLTLALTGLANTWYGAHSELFLYQNSTSGADDIEVEVVPEPGTWALMLGGLAMLVFWQRRKQKN